MNIDLETHDADNRSLIEGLRQALDIHYDRLLETAKTACERHFAGKDPSDACVSVRVTSGRALSRAGFLQKQDKSPLHGRGRRSRA
jgi:hypothetical protein